MDVLNLEVFDSHRPQVITVWFSCNERQHELELLRTGLGNGGLTETFLKSELLWFTEE